MFKVALIVVITYISNPEKSPNISLTGLYKDIKSCHSVMDELVKNINAVEDLDTEKNRLLKLHNREYHDQSIIYWSCKKIDDESL